ncbi:MAG: lipid-A-disaccharide synthase [Rickettsiales bacterium]|jgi:lipid-A-disaccharide synthase
MVKIFIIAGEPSGDVLGGKLMVAIKAESENQDIEFVGIGGKKMQEQGLESIFPISELSIMGFAEIVPHLPKLLKRIRQTAQDILDSQAQMVITIDSPDFCFRVIKKLSQNPNSKNIKKIHMIAPSVWAYRPKRAQKIAKLYDLLLAILPFEPPYFEKHGLETVFIGHPITEDSLNITQINKKDFRVQNQIKDGELLICAMAGSRVGEVKRMLPEIIGAVNILAQKHRNLVIVMPTIQRTRSIIEEYLDQFQTRIILIDESQKYNAFKASNLAIAKSGTNNLEIAIAGLPMITIYKINPITHFIVKRLIKIKYANLINLILNRELIPELLQKKCVSVTIANCAMRLIENPNLAEMQISEGKKVLTLLGLNATETPSQKAAKKILTKFKQC